MSHTVLSARELDNLERLRAFDAAVAHRGAMQRLARDLKRAATVDEADRIVDEMRHVGDEYEAWLRAESARMQLRHDGRAAQPDNATAVA
ncbi:MAG TPA: hypothetical protein VNO51_11490 [Ilumatobacteraceae bacterium]|nr:hypothetical protein [Ilumatobacteraceae bacterium]